MSPGLRGAVVLAMCSCTRWLPKVRDDEAVGVLMYLSNKYILIGGDS